MAEVIKYGIIASEEFYDYIKENKEKIKSGDKDCLENIIRKCWSRLKADVVNLDEPYRHKRNAKLWSYNRSFR